MDSDMKIEYALTDAVKNNKNFDNFAGAVRSLGKDLKLDANKYDEIFGALADLINEWE